MKMRLAEDLPLPTVAWAYLGQKKNNRIRRWLPRRWMPVLIPSICICTYFAFFILCSFQRHHAPFEYQLGDPLVHNKHVSELMLQYPSFDSARFEKSPQAGPPVYPKYDGRYLPWLAAVIVAPSAFEQRQLVRFTWWRLYRDVPFDGRFVIGTPPPEWADAIRAENRTHGDIIVLDGMRDNDLTAQTIKTLELYKWLIRNERKYEFVSKIDSDTFLNARGFWDRYLAPRIRDVDSMDDIYAHASPRQSRFNTIIGSLYYSRVSDLVYPHGSFYTCSWDMVETLVRLQQKHGVITGEDMSLAVLMLKGRRTANIVNLNSTEDFDFDKGDTRGDGSAWARKKTHPNSKSHAMSGNNSLVIHQLKDTDDYMRVADCFDEEGVKPTPKQVKSGRRTPMSLRWRDFFYSIGISSVYQSRLARVPSSYWSLKDGTWWIDDIWNMGPNR